MSNKYEITILVPTLNEELCIADFIRDCKVGLKNCKVNGQILIADSSNDNTALIAKNNGADVVNVSKKGLGWAYIESIKKIKGQYVILGDADLTYDFKKINIFYEKFKEGYEFIMGNRFKGLIEKGAMPPSHQYFGTPITTIFFNIIYNSQFKDIHCGMRGITLDALKKINLKSHSWQYASEMIIKSIHFELKSTEVPINFYKSKESRQSNLKRIGWWAPWHAGWITIEAILTWGIDRIFNSIGIMIFLGSYLILFSKSFLPLDLFFLKKISLNSEAYLLVLITMGSEFFFLSLISKVIYNKRASIGALKALTFNKFIMISLLLFLGGVFLSYDFFLEYIRNDFSLTHPPGQANFMAMFGLANILLSIIIFKNSLILNLLKINK